MQDVMNPVVAAYVFDSVGSWLYANPVTACCALLAAAAGMWCRSRCR